MINDVPKQLKEIFHRALVEGVASRVSAHYAGMDTVAFVSEIVTDFPQLALMARSRRIAEGLHTHLPASFADAITILLKSLGEDDGSGGVEGYDGFRHLPLLNFVGSSLFHMGSAW